MQCQNVPPLLLVGTIALLWGIVAAALAIANGATLASFKVPAGDCLFEASGTNGFRLLVFPAVLMIGPVDAAILSNVWIGSAIVLGLLMMGSKFSSLHIAGILCFGAALLMTLSAGLAPGHLLALAGGLAWGWYLARSTVVGGGGRQADALGNLAVGAVFIYLSYLAEVPWTLDASDLFWLGALIVSENIGYGLWLFGARHGEPRRSKIAVLFMPVVAVAWVMLLGIADVSWGQFAALGAVTMAGLLLSPHVFRVAKTARS